MADDEKTSYGVDVTRLLLLLILLTSVLDLFIG